MITRFMNCRVGSVLAALVLAGAVSGCASAPAFLGGTSRKITLNNVSSTALNITFYVWTDPEMMQGDDADEQFDESGAFICDKTMQLGRGSIVVRITPGDQTSTTRTAGTRRQVRVVKANPI